MPGTDASIMKLQCPNCREPVSFLRSLRTTAWGRFRCEMCGSILGISLQRRTLAVLVWTAVVGLLVLTARRQGYPPLLVLSMLIVMFPIALYLFEEVVLIEARSFCCKKCGYDLRGLRERRCPECGTDFDPAEKAVIPAGAASAPPISRRSLTVIALVLMGLLLAGLAANFFMLRASRAPRLPSPASPLGQ